MTTHTSNPTILPIPGHWLGSWAWDEVLEQLTALGARAMSLTLPGLDEADPDRTSRTLDDQVAAITQTASSAAEPVVIVAHSGANAPVTLLLDRDPELVRRVIWVVSGPAAPGMAFAPDFPDNVEALPLPPFEELKEQASLEGLNPAVLERFRTRALSQPGPVLRQAVHLTHEARFAVPTTFVCCSIPSAQVKELANEGHPMFAEVRNLRNVDYIDLPTGHWPMWSRPSDLAQILADVSSH